MNLYVVQILLFLLLQAIFGHCQYPQSPQATTDLDWAVERTRAMALIFAYIQCFPPESDMDEPSRQLYQIHETFDPLAHLEEYSNATAVENLYKFVEELKANNTPHDLAFPNSIKDIEELRIIFAVLYNNADKWDLFYKTAIWLLHRVNSLKLWWALKITSLEKFRDLVTTASSVETFPQLFVHKYYVLADERRGRTSPLIYPLQYWTSDPNLHEFHVQWHMDNPSWWHESLWGPKRHRRGELFLYTHHQILNRLQGEWDSVGMKNPIEPLGMEDDYPIPEGFDPDVVHVNYSSFFTREDNTLLGHYGSTANIKNWYNLLMEGIEQGYFVDLDGNPVILEGDEGTNILGETMEPSAYSANEKLYGEFHNGFHGLVGGMDKPDEFPTPGIMALLETTMRDPLFYRVHSSVDEIYLKYKSKMSAYTISELDFPGVSVASVTIEGVESGTVPVLTTHFKRATYDISNAARPCRAVNGDPDIISMTILDHKEFRYQIAIESTRPDETIRLGASNITISNRSSRESSLTHREPRPGIKQLYKLDITRMIFIDPINRRACGFPNNLLLPRGNKAGIGYTLTVFVSEETDMVEVGQTHNHNFPLCGSLDGNPFPDKRSMGFPFDRPGTLFTNPVGETITNSKQINVLVKHINAHF